MVEPPSLLWDPYGEPSHPDKERNLPSEVYKIKFRHPGYDDTDNILLILPGLDHPHGGIHHKTARVACAILANNEWAGFFTEDRAGKHKIKIANNVILHKKNYYFHVSNDASGKQKGDDAIFAI
jgi:hypothetical protein